VTDVKQLSNLISKVELRSIKLVECSCRGFAKELGESGEISVALNWSARPILHSAEAFSVLAEIQTLLTPPDGGEDDGARIWARFDLRYSLREKTELNEGLLEQFANMNGVFNVWSYWREFVQSTLLRMELPPVILPLYRMPAAVQETTGKSKAQ